MRVGLNATCLNARPSGAKQRFLGLYGALIRRRPDIEFVIYEPSDWSVAAELGTPPNVTFRRTPLPSGSRLARALRGVVYWRRQLARDRLDLFETFHLPLVRAANCPTLVTIHDARPVRYGMSPLKRRLQAALLRHALRRADQVVTVSRAMKSELKTIVPSAKVAVIYNGIDSEGFSASGSVDLPAQLGLPRPYLLTVGHLEPRKNHVRLIEALASLYDGGRDIGLVIVGNDSGEGRKIRAAIQDHCVGDRVRILHDVTDPELGAIYRGAALVVFPSTYEGFGIPLLEAMVAERPVVCSDLEVFQELTEGYGAYFRPDDVRSMVAAIEAVLDDPARRSGLVAYGMQRFPEFVFERLAGEVERIYWTLCPRMPQPSSDA